MPCYTVQTMSVEFKAEHLDLLGKAITALGWKVSATSNNWWSVQPTGATPFTIDFKAQKAVIVSSQQAKLNELKRAYSMEALKRVAVKNRWQISKTKATKGQLIRTY